MEWTQARIKAFIVAVLRSGTRRWPPKYETLNEAKTEKKVNVATGRLAQHYKCKKCKKDFPAKMVQVDHIKPVVNPKDGFVDWNTFIERLYCGKDNLQVLCKTCHFAKTEKERLNDKSSLSKRMETKKSRKSKAISKNLLE